ncbi:MAG: YegP family protein [Acidimicrobiales bacterium]
MAKAQGTFIVRTWAGGRGGTNKFGWELVSSTGQIMAKAEDFPSRETAENAIDWLKKNAAECPVEFVPPPSRAPSLA